MSDIAPVRGLIHCDVIINGLSNNTLFEIEETNIQDYLYPQDESSFAAIVFS